jgi:1-deoxy-D-xylulose-5-phosphate synthase
VDTPVRQHGIPQEFLDHAKRDAILERIGLTAQALARGIVEDVTALDHPEAEGDIHVASPVDRGTLD